MSSPAAAIELFINLITVRALGARLAN